MNPVDFHVISAPVVKDVLAASRSQVIHAVANAYVSQQRGESHCPPSGFLRFPGRERDRIISLPARFRHDGEDVAGVKWIASFPGNRDRNLVRASAVIVLNDMATGFPVACLEGSLVSAARTAASAALGARLLHAKGDGTRLGVIGCGPIARTVLEFLAHDGWAFSSVVVHDIAPDAAAAFVSASAIPTARAVGSAEEVLDESDLVVMATTSSTPHLHDPGLFDPRHTVLHLSLRDLAPAVVHPAQNFVDDVDLAFREETSLQLAAESHGDRAFLAGTIADLIEGAVLPDPSRTRIFSPFGLGTLDLAVSSLVLRQAIEADRTHLIEDFASGIGQG